MSKNYDVIVIGGGAAGIAALTAAIEKGAKAALFEQYGKPGGNGNFAAGIFGAGSSIQRRQLVEVDADAMFAHAMDSSHWKADARLLRMMIERSGDTIEWLLGMGVPLVKVQKMIINQSPEVFHVVDGPRPSGMVIIEQLCKLCEARGADIYTDTGVAQLLMESERVSGVRTAAGEEYHAQSVIIATGGFAANREMLLKYMPGFHADDVYPRVGIQLNGDGLRMAIEAGGFCDDDVIFEGAAPKLDPVDPAREPRASMELSAICNLPFCVWTDKFGERFADEGIVYNIAQGLNAINRLPGRFCWMLFDENSKERAASDSGSEKMEASIARDIAKGVLIQADTLDELANKTGMNAATLTASIARYNHFCTVGCDADFAKKRSALIALNRAPFYAARGRVTMLNTHGGIRVNTKMQVLRRDGTAIDGLFAAGVDISGIDSGGYQYELSGHSFGFAVNGGRIAGENAVCHAEA